MSFSLRVCVCGDGNEVPQPLPFFGTKLCFMGGLFSCMTSTFCCMLVRARTSCANLSFGVTKCKKKKNGKPFACQICQFWLICDQCHVHVDILSRLGGTEKGTAHVSAQKETCRSPHTSTHDMHTHLHLSVHCSTVVSDHSTRFSIWQVP